MELDIGKECGVFIDLFQQLVADMKGSGPVWDDFTNKTVKLHTALKTTILATTAFLDSFQKIADLASGSKGATRELGSALTRLCLRHRNIENRLKILTSHLLEYLVNPMQDKMEEWKKNVVQLDKEHTKENKKARAEIKRASSDTLRLQKKCKKGKPGQDLKSRLDTAMQEVNDKYILLEETEKQAVRSAMIEERSHFCFFVNCLKPAINEEINMLNEVSHLQEVLKTLEQQSVDPNSLPEASEQILTDIKSGRGEQQTWTHRTPPSSPSSLGSRKSSMCSINSLTSSNSGSTSHSSPAHNFRPRVSSQHLPPGVSRLSSLSSQDSGFTSQDTLFNIHHLMTSQDATRRQSSLNESGGSTGLESGNSPGPSSAGPGGAFPSTAGSTWSNWPDPPGGLILRAPEGGTKSAAERPHTISTTYEKAHTRPSLTAHTFEPPESSNLVGGAGRSPALSGPPEVYTSNAGPNGSAQSHYAVPCIVSAGTSKRSSIGAASERTMDIRPPVPGPKPRAKRVTPPIIPGDYAVPTTDPPVYVNQDDLARMANEMLKCQGRAGHEDILEEDEITEEEGQDVITPTPSNANMTMRSAVETLNSLESASTNKNQSQEGLKEDDYNDATPKSEVFTFDLTCEEKSRLSDDFIKLSESLKSLELAAAYENEAVVMATRKSPTAEEPEYVTFVDVQRERDGNQRSESASELAQAIRDLEETTAALEQCCASGQKQPNTDTSSSNARASGPSNNSRNSLPYSGRAGMYSTMSDEASLEDLDKTLTSLDSEWMELVGSGSVDPYATLPRSLAHRRRDAKNNSGVYSTTNPYATTATSSRSDTYFTMTSGVTTVVPDEGTSVDFPVTYSVTQNATGTSLSNTGSAVIRRSASTFGHGSKPPPPIRRNSSRQSPNSYPTSPKSETHPGAGGSAHPLAQTANTEGGGVSRSVCDTTDGEASSVTLVASETVVTATQQQQQQCHKTGSYSSHAIQGVDAGGVCAAPKPTKATPPPVSQKPSVASLQALSPVNQPGSASAPPPVAAPVVFNLDDRRASLSSDEDSSFELPPPPPPEELERDLATATAATHGVMVTNCIDSNTAAETSSKTAQMNGGVVLVSEQKVPSVSEIAHKYETASDSSPAESPPRPGTSSLQRTGSIADKHGQLMSRLDQKLRSPNNPPLQNVTVVGARNGGPGHPAGKFPTGGPYRPGVKGSPPAVAEKPAKQGSSNHMNDTDGDLTPTADSPVAGTWLAQIQNGVKLRKSFCNDRSTPKF